MIYNILRFANMAASTERLYLPQDYKAAHPNDQRTRGRWVMDMLHAFQLEEKVLNLYPYLIFRDSSCFTIMLGELRTNLRVPQT